MKKHDFVRYQGKDYTCYGMIQDIFLTTFGSKKKKLGARIGSLKNYPFKDRKKTVVALDRLKKISPREYGEIVDDK